MAGQLAALFLKDMFGARMKVSVVAPKGKTGLSVGESTNGPFAAFCRRFGIGYKTFASACNGSIKLASEFRDWNGTDAGDRWIHEFEEPRRFGGVELFHFWLRRKAAGEPVPSYDDACFLTSAYVDSWRVPFAEEASPPVPYAFHFESARFVSLLKRKGDQLGVNYVDGTLELVSLGPDGAIETAHVSDGQRVSADLFIDCTGLRRVLRDKMGETDAEDHSQSLLCDSAVVTFVPRKPGARVRPTTLGTALRNGWAWDIPLGDRTSFGYVFSSSHISRSDADVELGEFLNRQTETLHLRWRPTELREPWFKNCLALGLASCFLEPIESLTSATLIQELKWMVAHLPRQGMDPGRARRYNKLARGLYAANRDFVGLHYATAARRDSAFWSDVQSARRSDRLSQLLVEYPECAQDDDGIYDNKAHYGLLTARGIIPKSPAPLSTVFSANAASREFERVARERSQATDYPTHADFLASLG